jgi:hypothetical protein
MNAMALEFMGKLDALLREYGARISAEDHWQGYAECGSDVRITIDIPSVYTPEGHFVREGIDIDLGRYHEPKETEE